MATPILNAGTNAPGYAPHAQFFEGMHARYLIDVESCTPLELLQDLQLISAGAVGTLHSIVDELTAEQPCGESPKRALWAVLYMLRQMDSIAAAAVRGVEFPGRDGAQA